MSKKCRYDQNCHIKLCQFKHSISICEPEKVEKLKEVDDKINEKESVDEYKKYNDMSEYDQFDVGQEICLNICWSGFHKCMDYDEDNELLGVNVEKIRDDYNNRREERFFCEQCNYFSKEMEDVKIHYMKKHKKLYSCWECGKIFYTISEFKKHHGSYHFTVEELAVDSS